MLLDEFTTAVVVDEDEAAILVSGDLDVASSPRLSAALERAARADGVAEVIIDLSRVGFIDSNGLAVLLRAHQSLGEGRLTIRSPGRQSRRLLSVTGLDQVLRVTD